MTVAALEAEALGEILAIGRDRLAEKFFARARKIIDIPWSTAVGSDLSFPQVEGRRTPMNRFLNGYMRRLQGAAHEDARVSIAFLKVINMLAPPSSLLHPRTVWRVLKANLRPPGRGASAGPKEAAPELGCVDIRHERAGF
jgi:hypothetical protein